MRFVRNMVTRQRVQPPSKQERRGSQKTCGYLYRMQACKSRKTDRPNDDLDASRKRFSHPPIHTIHSHALENGGSVTAKKRVPRPPASTEMNGDGLQQSIRFTMTCAVLMYSSSSNSGQEGKRPLRNNVDAFRSQAKSWLRGRPAMRTD